MKSPDANSTLTIDSRDSRDRSTARNVVSQRDERYNTARVRRKSRALLRPHLPAVRRLSSTHFPRSSVAHSVRGGVSVSATPHCAKVFGASRAKLAILWRHLTRTLEAKREL